jgi:RHS repeat-associated protein
MRPSAGGGVDIYPIYSDHLDTPRLITDAANRTVWEWPLDTFGAGPANENPSGLGVFSFNLRFPGQYFDAETGLHYNYFRDYDPSLGRYVESDPMLRGGIDIVCICRVRAVAIARYVWFGWRGGWFLHPLWQRCGQDWSGGRETHVIPQNSRPNDSVDECRMTTTIVTLSTNVKLALPARVQRWKEAVRHRVSGLPDALRASHRKTGRNRLLRGRKKNAYFFCQKAKILFQVAP